MSVLLATEVAFPEHRVSQEEVTDHIGRWLEDAGRDARRIRAILANAGVAERHAVLSPDELFRPRDLGERNALYTQHAPRLAEQATRRVLERLDLSSECIDLVTSVSCTGFMIPSLDAHLANRLPLNSRIRRMPLTLLGCAGGAMGLSHAHDHLGAHPAACGLVVAVELASLSFQSTDHSMAHLVSSALFGDGAGACILVGEASPLLRGRTDVVPRIRSTATCFFHASLEAMGFDVRTTGFHMILDARIPAFLAETIWPEVERFLAENGLEVGDVEHWLVHPGGRRILDTVEACLARGPQVLATSRRVLREHGNLSSASILALLRTFADEGGARTGERGLILAFGPGFNAELLLVEWGPAQA